MRSRSRQRAAAVAHAIGLANHTRLDSSLSKHLSVRSHVTLTTVSTDNVHLIWSKDDIQSPLEHAFSDMKCSHLVLHHNHNHNHNHNQEEEEEW